MKLWSIFAWLTSRMTLEPDPIGGYQQRIPAIVDTKSPSRISGKPAVIADPVVSSGIASVSSPVLSAIPHNGPIFNPPGAGPRAPDFQCDYSNMDGYEACNLQNRSCWLVNTKTGHRFDVSSNYEDPSVNNTPKGIIREYTLVVEDGRINADGLWAESAKLVNGSYPGPWIQACWGDTVKVKVINKLKHNGTAVHFHGIRQLKTMHMDGVPGITQCPIAPGDYFEYKFKVLQYGSSWYHSHYSVQYADGLLGPMTLHGPSSADWDEPKQPLLMTDWFHNSAFQVIHKQVAGHATGLVNGVGDVTQYVYPERDDNGRLIKGGGNYSVTPNAPIPAKYTLHFQEPTKGRPRRYVMRLINTAFATTFLFSIDHHKFTIIGADFVPVKESEKRTHLQVGIGQRYTIVVEADPIEYNKGNATWDRKHPNFWIRTEVVKCFQAEVLPRANYGIAGVLRYRPEDLRDPITTVWPDINQTCKDEVGLVPVLPWKVGTASNGKNGALYGELVTVNLDMKRSTQEFPLGIWSFDREGVPGSSRSLQIDYDEPIFDKLWDLETGKQNKWKSNWVVIPEDYKDDDWVYLAIANSPGVKAAHPIHLHGHDFAIIASGDTVWNSSRKFKPSDFNTNNPMRRDVVLLPNVGWIIIAFKTDNPGSWIMHCHIAFHASEGLALQINERQAAANAIWPNDNSTGTYDDAIVESKRLCKRWKDFQHDCTQHWPGWHEQYKCWPACKADKPREKMFACPKYVHLLPPDHVFQDDSGI